MGGDFWREGVGFVFVLEIIYIRWECGRVWYFCMFGVLDWSVWVGRVIGDDILFCIGCFFRWVIYFFIMVFGKVILLFCFSLCWVSVLFSVFRNVLVWYSRGRLLWLFGGMVWSVFCRWLNRLVIIFSWVCVFSGYIID